VKDVDISFVQGVGGDDPISLWEGALVCGRARWIFRQHQPVLGDRSMELAVADRVRDVDSGAEYRYRFAALFDRGSVRRPIDSARHSAYDRDPGSDQSAGQSPGASLTIGGRLSRPDDRDARPRQS
jgi:hypothetical protein